MKGILILEITTSAPKDLMSKDNISIQVGVEGMSWKPEIDELHFWETELEHAEEKRALLGARKAIEEPWGEMDMGMNMGGSF